MKEIDDTAQTTTDTKKYTGELVVEDKAIAVEHTEIETLSDKEKESKPAEEKAEEEKSSDVVNKEKSERHDGYMKRINKLTGRNKQYESEIEADKLTIQAQVKEIEELKQSTVITDRRPVISNFEDDVSFLEALGDWRDKRNDAQNKAQEVRISKIVESNNAKFKTDNAQDYAQERLTEKLDRGRQNYDDFDKVALGQETLALYNDTTHNTVVDSDIADELTYYFGQNPDILTEISEIKSPTVAIKRIGVIENSLRIKTKDKIISDASEPISTVKGKKDGHKKRLTLDEMPYEEFVEARRKGVGA